MSETPSSEQDKALFAHLVISLAQSALMGMGKIVHPAAQKAEINLEAAQQSIDLLDMLDAKTRGNRDSEEDKMLHQTLSMLKLNYVETAGASAGAAPPADAGSAPPVGAGEEEKVRFRKKYD